MKVAALLTLTLTLTASTPSAQERPSRRPERSPAGGTPRIALVNVQSDLDRMDEAVETQSAALIRNSFIVTRLVAAVGALNDFQIGSAVQKALDEVEAAEARAKQKPVASNETMEMLDTVRSLLESARSQGTMANLPAIQREILTRLEPLQRTMFVQLDDIRRTRIAISDMQARLAKWHDSIDVAMIEALGASLDYTRKGGK